MCQLNSYSGALSEYIRSELVSLCDKVYTDRRGNIIGVKNGSTAKTLLLDAHMDRIGLMVREVSDNGMISFISVGGVDARILPACEVTVHAEGRDYYGVVAAMPPHLLEKGEDKNVTPLHKLYIDIGYKDAKKRVEVGDFISFNPKAAALLNNRVSSGGLDNMCGVYTLMRVMREIKTSRSIAVLISTGEEIGDGGCASALDDFDIDLAVVVDATHGLSPTVKPEHAFPLGGGVCVCAGGVIDKEAYAKVRSVARENNIPYKIEVEAGTTGTNADIINLHGGGVKTLLLSIPLRYMHTQVETADMSDIENCVKLINLFAAEY